MELIPRFKGKWVIGHIDDHVAARIQTRKMEGRNLKDETEVELRGRITMWEANAHRYAPDRKMRREYDKAMYELKIATDEYLKYISKLFGDVK